MCCVLSFGRHDKRGCCMILILVIFKILRLSILLNYFFIEYDFAPLKRLIIGGARIRSRVAF